MSVPSEQHGTFFSSDCYVVLHRFRLHRASLFTNLFFWLGEHSHADDQGAAAIMAAELDERLWRSFSEFSSSMLLGEL